MHVNYHAGQRVTHLSVRNWKNFTQLDADLEQRVFLIGPNASGKSNFLDLFRFLRDIVSVGGGFREAIQRRGGVSAIRSLAARREPSVDVTVALGTSENPNLWNYTLRFSQDKQRRPRIEAEKVLREARELFSRPNKEDVDDPDRLGQTFLEQVNVNREFREIADFFNSVRYLHIVPQLVRDPDRSVGRKDDPFGGDFIKRVATTGKRTRDTRLRRITKALQVAVPQLRELELWQDDVGRPHLRGKYEHWRPQGAWQMEDQFSDGTLRLTGLLWAALDGAGPLLLEEPELSLHPEVVRFIPQLFARIGRKGGRQVILSTHSPELLQDQGIGVDEVLLLIPKGEGTEVRVAAKIDQVRRLLDGGLSMADAVLPHTRPQRIEQLRLWEE